MNNVTLRNQVVDFDAAVELMDEEIREQLHAEMAPCGEQEFLDAYIEAHAKKYNEEFTV